MAPVEGTDLGAHLGELAHEWPGSGQEPHVRLEPATVELARQQPDQAGDTGGFLLGRTEQREDSCGLDEEPGCRHGRPEHDARGGSADAGFLRRRRCEMGGPTTVRLAAVLMLAS